MRIWRLQQGDTIVEVLIAIAVASSVLAVTYATMNRNLTITRVSQERTEASKLAQGQLEALKARTDAGRVVSSNNFCIDASGGEVVLPVETPDDSLAADDFSKYVTPDPDDPDCTASGRYNYVIKEISTGTYKAYVRWDRVGGGSREEVVMVYKL